MASWFHTSTKSLDLPKGLILLMAIIQQDKLKVRPVIALWLFQVVVFRGKRYGLTTLGFGLNVVPQIMKTIVSAVLSQEEAVEKATLAYLNDIYINEDVRIEKIQSSFKTECTCWTWMSGGRKASCNGTWRVVLGIPEVLTRWTVFSLCRKLVRHLPVCGWLCAAVGVIKHGANVVTSGWDNQTSDACSTRMTVESVERVTHEDPAQGE